MTTPIPTPAELEELEQIHVRLQSARSPEHDWCCFCNDQWPCPPVRLIAAVRALQAERKCPIHDTAWGSHCINLPSCPSPSDGGDEASEELQAHDSLLRDGDL